MSKLTLRNNYGNAGAVALLLVLLLELTLSIRQAIAHMG